MGIVDSLVSGGIKGTLEGIGSLAKDLRSAITGDVSPEKKAELESKIMEIENRAKQAQTDINMQEAKHTSIFVAGWRPFVGWVCGFALFYNFILHNIIGWLSGIYNFPVPPELQLGALVQILMAMLGLGGLRSFEKTKGVSRETWKVKK